VCDQITYRNPRVQQKFKMFALEIMTSIEVDNAPCGQSNITLHFSSSTQSIMRGLQLMPRTKTHVIVGTLATDDDLIRALPKQCHRKQSQELQAALALADISMHSDCAISYYNCSLEEMINANDLGVGSVSTIIDLSGLWFTTCQSGNDRMREMLLSFLAPNAILYTTYCPIINGWMRLVTNNGETHPMEEFVDTNFTFGEGADKEKIFEIQIRRALEGTSKDDARDKFLQILESWPCACTLEI
jgi:hypothetical protein